MSTKTINQIFKEAYGDNLETFIPSFGGLWTTSYGDCLVDHKKYRLVITSSYTLRCRSCIDGGVVFEAPDIQTFMEMYNKICL